MNSNGNFLKILFGNIYIIQSGLNKFHGILVLMFSIDHLKVFMEAFQQNIREIDPFEFTRFFLISRNVFFFFSNCRF